MSLLILVARSPGGRGDRIEEKPYEIPAESELELPQGMFPLGLGRGRSRATEMSMIFRCRSKIRRRLPPIARHRQVADFGRDGFWRPENCRANSASLEYSLI